MLQPVHSKKHSLSIMILDGKPGLLRANRQAGDEYHDDNDDDEKDHCQTVPCSSHILCYSHLVSEIFRFVPFC